MRVFLNGNRHQTVTKTEHQEGLLRKSFTITQLSVRRAGIEPATYEFKGISLSKLIRGFPRRIISETVRIARKARESVLDDRNANVIANPRNIQFELSVRQVHRDREQRALDLLWRSGTWQRVFG